MALSPEQAERLALGDNLIATDPAAAHALAGRLDDLIRQVEKQGPEADREPEAG